MEQRRAACQFFGRIVLEQRPDDGAFGKRGRLCPHLQRRGCNGRRAHDLQRLAAGQQRHEYLSIQCGESAFAHSVSQPFILVISARCTTRMSSTSTSMP